MNLFGRRWHCLHLHHYHHRQVRIVKSAFCPIPEEPAHRTLIISLWVRGRARATDAQKPILSLWVPTAEVNPSMANYQLLVPRNCGQTWDSTALGDSMSPCTNVPFTGMGGTFLRVAPGSKWDRKNNENGFKDFLFLPPEVLRRCKISRLDGFVSVTSLSCSKPHCWGGDRKYLGQVEAFIPGE